MLWKYLIAFGLFITSLTYQAVTSCEVEEQVLEEEQYDCNKTITVWTKKKCMLFFQCDKQVQRIVPTLCRRNVTRTTKNCCIGYRRNELNECKDINECSEGKHKCNGKCINVPGSFKCECDDGFQLADDKTTCIDINECNDHLLHNCSHACLNSHGSYSCLCPGSLQLSSDGKRCIEVTTVRQETTTHNYIPRNSSMQENETTPIPVVTPVSSYQTSEKSISGSPVFIVMLVAGIAIFVVVLFLVLSFVYRRRGKQLPWMRKHNFLGSPANSVCDIIQPSNKSKVLENSGFFGIDTSKAKVFKKNSISKSSPLSSVAFSSAATGVSSVTLMCPNVIAGSENGANRDGTAHIYCELKEENAADGNPQTIPEERSSSPCYASLPIAQVKTASPTDLKSPSQGETFLTKSNANVYHNA